jgi:hypothetical protein
MPRSRRSPARLFAMTEAGKKDPAAAKANAAVAAQTLRAREQREHARDDRSCELKRDARAHHEAVATRRHAQAETEALCRVHRDAAKDHRRDAARRSSCSRQEPRRSCGAACGRPRGAARRERRRGARLRPTSLAVYEKAAPRRARGAWASTRVAPTQATPKKNTQAADKKHPAKTLGNDLSTPRVPRPTRSDREQRAETLEMLESGKARAVAPFVA